MLGAVLGSRGLSGAETIHPGPCVSYQRATDYGVDEYLMADLYQEIKTTTSWRIASLLLVKNHDDSAALSPLC